MCGQRYVGIDSSEKWRYTNVPLPCVTLFPDYERFFGAAPLSLLRVMFLLLAALSGVGCCLRLFGFSSADVSCVAEVFPLEKSSRREMTRPIGVRIKISATTQLDIQTANPKSPR